MTEIVEQIMGRGNGGSVLFHNGTSDADKEGTKIHKDGSERDGGAALHGRLNGICGTALWGKEEMYVRDGMHLSGKGVAIVAMACVKYDI